MSRSHTHKTGFATGVAVVGLLLSGCGGDGQTPAAGPTANTGVQATTPTTGATAATRPSGGSSGPTPASATEQDLVPVDVKLADGGFSKSTPKTFHVPSGFLILVTVKSGGGGPYSLSVLSPSTAQTLKVASNSHETITLDGLASGKTAKLILGGQTVKISADAEPGP